MAKRTRYSSAGDDDEASTDVAREDADDTATADPTSPGSDHEEEYEIVTPGTIIDGKEYTEVGETVSLTEARVEELRAGGVALKKKEKDEDPQDSA